MCVSGPVRIAFRADASLQIGTGHVMRCLTLADHLRELGVESIFLGRPHAGNLLDLVGQRGHVVLTLPAREPVKAMTEQDPVHSTWLGGTWDEDAKDCILALRQHLDGACVDWLVVDHYALDMRWETSMRSVCCKILAIDDLADRRHDCDLLLDQNLGRKPVDYDRLLPSGTSVLIGPRYALLRPEFARLRDESLARRQEPVLERLLITMGGVDKDNVTGWTLEALDQIALPPELNIDIVLGPHAPWLEQVRAQAAEMTCPTRVLAGVDNMAKLMSDSDLAIGAAGSTSWERCCLGLPTIQIVIAKNQTEAAAQLEAVGAVEVVSSMRKSKEELCQIMRSVSAKTLSRLSQISSGICSGDGVDVLADHLLATVSVPAKHIDRRNQVEQLP